MAIVINDMDRISRLPEPMMQQILFRLPGEDAVRMSFVSRTWQSLWNLLPFSDFDFDIDPIGGYRKRKRSESKDDVTWVDTDLKILQQHNDQKRIINFTLSGEIGKKKHLASHQVDRWVKLVTKNYVRVLRLNLFNFERPIPIRYRFPPPRTNLDLGSLVVLRLSHCVLKKALIQEGTRFSCLKELSLFLVDLNGLARKLLSRCPSVETLEFSYCNNLKHLQLCESPKLKKVKLDHCPEDFSYKIEASNLQILHYFGTSHPLDLEAVNCSNLKELIICTSSITNQYAQSLQKLNLKFPFLEELTISVNEDIEEMKISSHQLKIFKLISPSVSYLDLDTPNLLNYSYHGEKISASFLLNSVKLEDVSIDLNLHNTTLDISWFLKLRQHLGKFMSPERLVLRLSSPCSEIKFSPEELREEEMPPLPSKVKVLLVGYISSSLHDTFFIDAFLRSYHPITLSVEPKFNEPNRSELIKAIHEKLLCKKENPLSFGESRHIKCWRHCVNSIKIIRYFGFKDGQLGLDDKDLSMSLSDLDEVSSIDFELQWVLEN